MTGRPFTVFDIDGTLIRWQLYHAVFDALATKGLIDAQVYQQIRAARQRWKLRAHRESYKEYELSIVEAYGNLLKTLSLEQYEQAIKAVFEEYKDQTYTYTRNLIKDLKARDYLLLAISGSPSEIVSLIADYYGFDDFVAATFERRAGRFTGKEISTIFNKGEVLKSLVSKHHATFAGSIGVGDGFSDRLVLELVETAIAFNPESKLFNIAQEKGWQIVVERKNVVYKLEQQSGRYLLA